MGILLKFTSGLLRRLLGGWLSTKEIISERGVQWTIGVLLYGSAILIKSFWFGGYNTWLFDWLPLWLFVILGALSIVLCLTGGHFPGFMCGTESRKYIDEQITNGRNIKFQKLVDWIGEKRTVWPRVVLLAAYGLQSFSLHFAGIFLRLSFHSRWRFGRFCLQCNVLGAA